MRKSINNVLRYSLKTRRTWWFTAIAKTKARYARTVLGSFWLGISTLMTVLCLGFVYGTVFNVSNFLEYFIYLGFGLVIWTPICEAINQAPLIFSTNSNSLKNSTIKPIFFVCQEWAFQVQSFLQAFIMVFVVFLIFSQLIIGSFFGCNMNGVSWKEAGNLLIDAFTVVISLTLSLAPFLFIMLLLIYTLLYVSSTIMMIHLY